MTRGCNITGVPTKQPRIGVTADAELRAALAATRDLVGEPDRRSQAGQLRRLALIGADALLEESSLTPGERDYQRILARSGGASPRAPRTTFPWLEGQEIDETNEASRILDWVRGER